MEPRLIAAGEILTLLAFIAVDHGVSDASEVDLALATYPGADRARA